MIAEIFQELELTAGGGTHNLDVTSPTTLSIVKGAATMEAAWAISTTGTLQPGMKAVICYKATMVFGEHTLTILGTVIPDHLQSKVFTVIGIYDGSAWKNVVLPNMVASESINGDVIVQSTLNGNRLVNASVLFSKLAALAEGSILIGNDSNVVVALDVSADGAILIGNGTTAVPQVISGDVVIDSDGVAAIQAGVITEEMLAIPPSSSFFISANLNQDQVNNSSSEPYLLFPTSSVASDEAVALIEVYMRLVSGGEAFSFADDMVIETLSGQVLARFAQTNLEGATTRIFSASFPTPDSRDLVLNSGLQIRSLTSDPTGGAGASMQIRVLAQKFTF